MTPDFQILRAPFGLDRSGKYVLDVAYDKEIEIGVSVGQLLVCKDNLRQLKVSLWNLTQCDTDPVPSGYLGWHYRVVYHTREVPSDWYIKFARIQRKGE